MQWKVFRCVGCRYLRERFTPAYPSCKAERLCDLIDPTLIEHRPWRRLEDYGPLSDAIERGAVLLGREMNGVCAWPATPSSFTALLRAGHRRLLFDALPEIAGRFRRSGEKAVFGGDGAHNREGARSEDIEGELHGLFRDTALAAFGSGDPHIVALACAQFLVRFFRIHPFVDGNGRIGRATVELLCRLGGTYSLRQFDTSSRSRRKYLKALQYAHRYTRGVDDPPPQRPRCPPIFLARWLRPHLERLPPPTIEEASPPEFPPEFEGD